VAEKEEEEAMEETESTVDMPKLMAMKSDNSELAVRPSTPPIRPSRLLQFVSDYDYTKHLMAMGHGNGRKEVL
jgi:hypothetical protein